MEDKYQEYGFTVEGTVYATSPSHAQHCVYWAMEESLKYQDASHAGIRFSSRGLETPLEDTPKPKPATEHISLCNPV